MSFIIRGCARKARLQSRLSFFRSWDQKARYSPIAGPSAAFNASRITVSSLGRSTGVRGARRGFSDGNLLLDEVKQYKRQRNLLAWTTAVLAIAYALEIWQGDDEGVIQASMLDDSTVATIQRDLYYTISGSPEIIEKLGPNLRVYRPFSVRGSKDMLHISCACRGTNGLGILSAVAEVEHGTSAPTYKSNGYGMKDESNSGSTYRYIEIMVVFEDGTAMTQPFEQFHGDINAELQSRQSQQQDKDIETEDFIEEGDSELEFDEIEQLEEPSLDNSDKKKDSRK